MRVDVAIIGVGPAGCSTALELVRLGRNPVVVTQADRRESPTFGECLPPSADALLDQLQLATPDPQHHLPCLANESAWGQEQTTSNDFIFNPYGRGWHLDRLRFDQMLREAILAKGVPILEARPESSWIADCTGRGSAIARHRGARVEGIDRLVSFAAIADCQTGRDRDSATFTESVPDGWWYTARLANNRRVVAFHTDGDLPACQIARHHKGFQELLDQTRHIWKRLSGYSVPKHFPIALAAGGRWLTPVYGAGWVAVGDAAQSYDPLSSQGLSHALEGGIRAAFALHAALKGDYRHLRRYQTLLDLRKLQYESLRYRIYSLEERWPSSAFWKRRQVLNGPRRRPVHSAGADAASAPN